MAEAIRRAFIFPGQGSQYAKMADILVHNIDPKISQSSNELFQKANRILGYDLLALCSRDPLPNELNETSYVQPAIYTTTVAALIGLAKMDKAILPSAVLGHSLGEYAALVAAGCLSFEDGLKLVQERGKLMKEAGEINPGRMAAVIRLPKDKPIEWLNGILDEVNAKEAREEKRVYIANYNSPSQIIIGGGEELMEEIQEKLGRKSIPLKGVSIASHTPLMKPAVEGMRNILDEVTFNDPKIDFYQNVTGEKATTAKEIKQGLIDQLTNPVQFYKALKLIIDSGITEIVEVGPTQLLKLSGIIEKSPLGEKIELKNSDKILSKLIGE